MGRACQIAVRCACLLPLLAACDREPATRVPVGRGSFDTGCPAVSITDGSQPLFTNACGGTATATGTTPLGPFSPTKVWGDYHCGTIVIELSDATGYARLTISFSYSAGSLGNREATIVFQGPPRGDPLITTTGFVMLTALTDPVPSSTSAYGMIAGTFTVTSDCLSIGGTFATPYCAYDSLCG